MSNRELREWLGLTLADLLVYLAVAAIVAMFIVTDPTADAVLAVVGVGLALAACPFGMKPDPKVSGFTNGVKLVSYPACVLLAAGAIAVHYLVFNR
ncbi:hypothetical protein J0H58_17545 [bacterium]|nr:hypothetical protein [bacterium]